MRWTQSVWPVGFHCRPRPHPQLARQEKKWPFRVLLPLRPVPGLFSKDSPLLAGALPAHTLGGGNTPGLFCFLLVLAGGRLPPRRQGGGCGGGSRQALVLRSLPRLASYVHVLHSRRRWWCRSRCGGSTLRDRAAHCPVPLVPAKGARTLLDPLSHSAWLVPAPLLPSPLLCFPGPFPPSHLP